MHTTDAQKIRWLTLLNEDKDGRIEALEEEMRELRAQVGQQRDKIRDLDERTDPWYVIAVEHPDQAVAICANQVDEIEALKARIIAHAKICRTPDVERRNGRPLEATRTAKRAALKLLGAGLSLRKVAAETNLSFQTIRTINSERLGRLPRRDVEQRKLQANRDAQRRWRARQKALAALPEQVIAWRGEVKEALAAAEKLAARHGV